MGKWPTALIDFDGVIHRYSKGWNGGAAYDEPMPGAQEALTRLEAMGYNIVIFSTRDADQIKDWFKKYGFPSYRVTNIKEPALFILDDRAVHFKSWKRALDAIRNRYPID